VFPGFSRPEAKSKLDFPCAAYHGVFPKIIEEMSDLYTKNKPEDVSKKYAPTIALRVEGIKRELRHATSTVESWVANVPRVTGRPDVLHKTLVVWKKRTDPLPLDDLVDGYNDFPATFPH